MRIFIIFSFLLVQSFLQGQDCLEIQYVQEVGSKARFLFDYLSDFKTSHFEFNRGLNEKDTIVIKKKKIKGNCTYHNTHTVIIEDSPIKSLLHKNFKQDSIQSFNNIFPSDEIVISEESIPKINWTITQEQDSILNFKVQKATGHLASKEYIAWFAISIPLKDGPRKLTGLPGMILKAESVDGQMKYYPYKIKIHQGKCVVRNPLNIYPETERITIDEFKRRQNKALKNWDKYLRSNSSGHKGTSRVSIKSE